MSPVQFLKKIMSTPQDYASTVNSFYLAFYGRPADPTGLKFWSQQLVNTNGDFAPVIQEFANSQETQVRFASQSVAGRIAEIYEQLFHRAPDAAGLAFYTNTVEQGQATLADVALSILNGARDSDKTLSELRQQAADAFTAQVEASGSAYDGYASIEAARVLVRAVTLDTKPADMATLVKAAVAFSDIATKNPEVVGAIASGGPLLAMFDTARGLAEPVALLQSLADTAKAAAGNPETLESLLRGGGMTKVLQVMPAAATLKDVVDALGTGGLPAAVEVVYPSTPVVVPQPVPVPVPEAALKLAFDHVAESALDINKRDNVTNVAVADVTFKYTGKDLAAGQKFIASIDGGKTWDQVVLNADAKANTVTATSVELAPKALPKLLGGSLDEIQIAIPEKHTTTIEVRAVDANNTVIDAFTQQIVYDGHVATPGVTFGAGISTNSHFLSDMVASTSSVLFDTEGVEQGARVEYAADPKSFFDPNSEQTNVKPVWSAVKPQLKDGPNSFLVRQVDVAGNVSNERLVKIMLDTAAPEGTPVISLVEDTGSGRGDGVTNVAWLAISGLDKHEGNGWEYSTDNGANWTFGGVNDNSGTGQLDISNMGKAPVTIQVRQLDAAGNVSPASHALTFRVDTAAPTNVLSFSNIDGATGSGQLTTNATNPDVYFNLTGSLATDEFVEWRVTGSDEWTKLNGNAFTPNGDTTTVVIRGLDLTRSDPTLEIRVSDTAGNHTTALSQKIDGPFNSTPRISVAPGIDGIELTSNVKGDILFNTSSMSFLLASTAPGMGAVVGTTTLRAPGMVSTGTVSIVTEGDVIVNDESGTVFALGTDRVDRQDELTGHYVWGFAGQDRITDTAGDDYLVGGLDADQIFLTNGGNDTVVVAAGHTAINSVPVSGNVSTMGMDMITNATIGDVIQMGKVFTAKPTLQTDFLLDPSANHYAVVRGEERGGTFMPGNNDISHTSYLVQWADGANVHSIVLRLVGKTAPSFEFDIDKGTMTLATPPQESGETETPAQPPVVIPDPNPNDPSDTPADDPSDTQPPGDLDPLPPINTHYAYFDKTVDGVTINTDVNGNMYSTQVNGGQTAVFANGSSVPQHGGDTIGAQPLATSGTIWYDAPGGPYSDDVKYTLGTNSRDQNLNGQNVWGFNGDDKITGTTGGDYLVGGKGADTIDVGNDDARDLIVFAAGDTLTGLRSGASVSGMDVIVNMHIGDIIQLNDVFSGAVSQFSGHVGSVAANQVGVVRGHLFADVFTQGTADNIDVSWLVEWSDGTTVNSVVLANLGNLAPQFDINVQNDTMTLASLVGVSNGGGDGIPGG